MLIQEAHTKLRQLSHNMIVNGITVSVIWCGNEITIQCPKVMKHSIGIFIEAEVMKSHSILKTFFVNGPSSVIYRLVFTQPVGERAPQLPDEFIGCPNLQ